MLKFFLFKLHVMHFLIVTIFHPLGMFEHTFVLHYCCVHHFIVYYQCSAFVFHVQSGYYITVKLFCFLSYVSTRLLPLPCAHRFWRMKGENTEARLYSLDLTLKWLELAGKRGEYAIISYFGLLVKL